jgi:hypothetical protein
VAKHGTHASFERLHYLGNQLLLPVTATRTHQDDRGRLVCVCRSLPHNHRGYSPTNITTVVQSY